MIVPANEDFQRRLEILNEIDGLTEEKQKLLKEARDRVIYEEFQKIPNEQTKCCLVNLIKAPNSVEVFRHIATTRNLPRSNFRVTLSEQKFLISLFGTDKPKRILRM